MFLCTARYYTSVLQAHSTDLHTAVTLSKVKKHGRERKESLIGNVRQWASE